LRILRVDVLALSLRITALAMKLGAALAVADELHEALA